MSECVKPIQFTLFTTQCSVDIRGGTVPKKEGMVTQPKVLLSETCSQNWICSFLQKNQMILVQLRPEIESLARIRLKVYILWWIFITHFVVKLLHFYTKIEFYQWFQYWIKLSMTFSNAVFYGLSKSGLKFFLPTFFIWILVIFGIIGTIFSASFFLQIVKKWKRKKNVEPLSWPNP